MPDPEKTTAAPANQTSFEQAAAAERLPLWREFLLFLKEEKKWWLLPIILVLGLVGLLVFLGGTGFAPFIYQML